MVPNARGRGAGAAMLEALLVRARAGGYAAISLSVDRSNGGAIHLYEQHGFRAVAEVGDSLTMRAPLA